MTIPQFALSIGGTDIPAPSGIPSGSADGEIFVQTIVNSLFGLAAILAIIFLIWGGMQWSASGGDKQALDAAKKRITYSIIGLVVVILSFVLVNFVGSFLGVTLKMSLTP